MKGMRGSFGVDATFVSVVTLLAMMGIGCAEAAPSETTRAPVGGAFVQGTQGSWDGEAASHAELAFAHPILPGHVLLACAEWSAPSDAKLSVTDTGGHAWHELSAVAAEGTGQATQCWYALNAAPATTTVSYSLRGAKHVRGFVYDYAGAAANDAKAGAVALR